MTNLAYKEKNYYIENWDDCYVSEDKNTGMLATLDLSYIKSDGPLTYFYSLDTFNKVIDITEREKPYKNMYLSLNAFKYIDGEIKRRSSHLAQIRNIGIDVDCYKIGISPEECKKKIFEMIEHSKFPSPNLVINSGNGIQLIYSIEGGAAPTFSMQWWTLDITRKLTGQLIHLGADFQTCSLERVFRLPNTYNEKIGYAKKLVTVERWNLEYWTLERLNDYVEPYKPAKKSSRLSKETPLMGYKKGMRTLTQMNMARANDLIKLSFLRDGHIENRNILCYDYAFALALGSSMSRSEIQEATLQLDSSFTSQQKRNVLRTTVKSAIDRADAFWRAYAKNSYSIYGLDKNLVKPKQTRTIIREHAITATEMEELEVIIDKAEIERRRTLKRRAKGEVERSEYLNQCQGKTANKLKQLKELLAVNPKVKKTVLAKELGISRQHLYRLLKEI